MTMRTYFHFVCKDCGHRGHERLSENDQPYSKSWERTELFDLGSARARSDGKSGPCYACPNCAGDMLPDAGRPEE